MSNFFSLNLYYLFIKKQVVFMVLAKTDRKFGSLENLTKILKDLLMNEEDILLAYLYGSYSKATQTVKSDLDIGIYVKSQALTDVWFPIRIKHLIEDKIHQNIDVDVRMINNAPI
ncbi:MAG: nucleotidyltransferase domain-containing protein, partial [Candidatus Heimdallarchaeota archaeon]|nr:nucleotidyltransferase domain-containing protein [Candidatus Heimdallarchaeota archaeon]